MLYMAACCDVGCAGDQVIKEQDQGPDTSCHNLWMMIGQQDAAHQLTITAAPLAADGRGFY